MENKIFIGENLKVMKSKKFDIFSNKIDFIYIDPPYNTKNKFIFDDNNQNWKNDISERLIYAKKFLKTNSVVFISIDDNELLNLLSVCNKAFGEKNFVGIFVTKQAIRSNAKHINVIHEYVVCYANNKKKLDKFYISRLLDPIEGPKIKRIVEIIKSEFNKSPNEAKTKLKKLIENYVRTTGLTWIKNYSNIDENGNIFFAKDLSCPGTPNSLDINEIGIHLKPLKTRRWCSKEKLLDLYKSKRIIFKNNRPYAIEYINEATNNVTSILNFYSRHGSNDLKKLSLHNLFDTPKPVELIKFLIRCSLHKDSIIFDFYAGSGTTAQAIYEVNKEDGFNHKYILIQLPEKIKPNSNSWNVMLNHGVKNPTIADALLLRVNTFLKLNGIKRDYELITFN